MIATLTGQSIGTLFLAGVIPGLFYMTAMLFLVWWISRRRNYPLQGRSTGQEILIALRDAFFALFLSVFVLIGIRSGVFNITECAVVAAIYALFVGTVVYRRITYRIFVESLASAARTISVIMIIVAAARLFSWVLAYLGIPAAIADFVLANFTDPLMSLIFLNLMLLIVGMFIETNAAIVMIVPVFYPISQALGVDPTHFSVLVVVNLCIGLITPPAGLCLNIATILAKTDLEDGVRGVLPFLGLAIVILAILTLFPEIVLWLPDSH